MRLEERYWGGFSDAHFSGYGERSDYRDARAVILPIEFGATVSYGRGAEKGPGAIIESSLHMEHYDEETGTKPSELGIHTLKPVNKVSVAREMVEKAGEVASKVLEDRKFLVTLGGEHTVALGAVLAHSKHYEGLSVLVLDAHSDLYEEYEGEEFSHACFSRRLVDNGIKTVIAGVRSISREQHDFARNMRGKGLEIVHGFEMKKGDCLKRIIRSLGNRVYISIDLDVLDPSEMPATGTPEPGGLSYMELCSILRAVAREKKVVGFDVVELAPIQGIEFPNFTAAKIVYKALSYAFEKES